jgi:hypothetical protein
MTKDDKDIWSGAAGRRQDSNSWRAGRQAGIPHAAVSEDVIWHYTHLQAENCREDLQRGLTVVR